MAYLLTRTGINSASSLTEHLWVITCLLIITLQQTKPAQTEIEKQENLEEESLALYLFTEDLIAPSSSARWESLEHLINCNLKPKKYQPSHTH